MHNQSFSINIISSLQKRLLIIIPHVLSVMVLIWLFRISAIPTWLLLALLACIVFSGFYYHRLHSSYKTKKTINRIALGTKDNWEITLVDNQSYKAQLSPSSFSSNFLIIMNFVAADNNDYTVLITPDSVASEEFRKLKVILKVEKFSVK